MLSVTRRIGCLVSCLMAWQTLPAAAQQFTPVTGDGDGIVLSADARFVMSTSRGALVPDDTNDWPDVYVRDTQTGAIDLVSIGTHGERVIKDYTGTTYGSGMSPDGRFVLFLTTSSLVPQDNNKCDDGHDSPSIIGCRDLYVRDRLTHETTLVTQSTDGTAGNSNSDRGSMSDDGRFVVFFSASSNLTPGGVSYPTGFFLRDRQAGTTTRIDPPMPAGGGGAYVSDARISGDGNSILYTYWYSLPAVGRVCPGYSECAFAAVMDRATGAAQALDIPLPTGAGVDVDFGYELAGFSTNGRFALLTSNVFGSTASLEQTIFYDRAENRPVILQGGVFNSPNMVSLRADGRAVLYTVSNDGRDTLRIYDDIAHETYQILGGPTLSRFVSIFFASLSSDGSRVFFTTSSLSNTPVQPPSGLYSMKIDNDGDGMPDGWETQFGLNPNDPGDATGDADGDGKTNLQEYLAGTHPNGKFARYLAEGSSNTVFSTRIAILNPGNTAALALVRFQGPADAAAPSVITSIPARTRITVDNAVAGIGDFSTVVESDALLVVERTMSVQGVGHGAMGETAIVTPSTTWYFAEGATGGPFSLFYLLQNPGDATAQVSVEYLMPSPQAPLTKTYTVAPRTRVTIFVDQEDPVLASTNVSAKITADQPIVAERTLYLASLNQPLGAAEGGAGATAPATRWFLAEGATGSFFDLYVLLANAETTDANVTLTYLLPDGTHFDKSYVVGAQSRQTILVDDEDPRLVDTPVSIVATSTNAVPVVVERAMWWPQSGWYEGHLSLGATTTAKKWALAEGESGGPQGAQTYILIANTSNTPGTATVSPIIEGASTQPAPVVIQLPANSRTNVPASMLVTPGTTASVRFGAVIESSGVDLVVERSEYWNVGGTLWAAGTAALGAPIP